MSTPVTLWRVTKYAVQDFIRNAWLGLATAFVLVLALLSVNVLVGVNALVDHAVVLLEDKIDVSVYFAQNAPDAVVEQAQFFMASLPQVRDATLLPPDQALEAFRARHANDPKILEALGELDTNPLGAALVIRAKRTEDYPFLLEALKNPQFDSSIESKSYDDHADAIARVRDIGKSARLFGAVLIAVFALFSAMIIFNAIRVAIYTQRDEIGIMRLVGASGLFVRLPFIIEGLLIAAVALVFSGALVGVAAAFFDPRLRGFFDGTDPGLLRYYAENMWRLIGLEGGGLAVLVILSSWAAVGKYLKK